MPELDSRLQADCHVLGQLDTNTILLMDNSLFPWLILVPDTSATELHQLPDKQRDDVLQLVNKLSVFIDKHFSIDKLNTAAIGNIVSQLHIHIVGRRQDDACWPGVVWGCNQREPYEAAAITKLQSQLITDLPNFKANHALQSAD